MATKEELIQQLKDLVTWWDKEWAKHIKDKR